MGNRGNIVVQSRGERVFLYTHWSGSRIREVVQKALARKQRWDDPPYLTRIMFDTLTEDAHGEDSGYGIWPSLGDNGHPIITVDVDEQRVLVGRGDDLSGAGGSASFADWARGHYPREYQEDEE